MHSTPEESAESQREAKMRDLWQRFGADLHNTEIRNALIEEYLPLVRSIAEKIRATLPRSVTFNDLFSTGVLGLIDAIEKFDPDRGVIFVNYACRRIRGEILDELRRNNFVPRDVLRQIKKHQKIFSHLYAIHGRPPTEEEIAEKMNMDIEKYRNFVQNNPDISFVSLEVPANPKGDDVRKKKTIGDILIDKKSPDPQNGTWVQEEFWQKMFEQLTIRECILLILFYRERKTMPTIGKCFGMSQPGISQIHTNIIRHLKERFVNHQGKYDYMGLLKGETFRHLSLPPKEKPSLKRKYRKRWKVQQQEPQGAAQEI